jgi:penicillin-binding protein-related factor A (putative recombinase)
MYFCIRDGVQIKEIYRVPTKTVIPYLKEKSTGGKSIHGHWGTNKDKLINELNATKVI